MRKVIFERRSPIELTLRYFEKIWRKRFSASPERREIILPAFDHVLMFKIVVLQTYHTLSDERTEFLLRGRFTFMGFLGLGLSDRVPELAQKDREAQWMVRQGRKPQKTGKTSKAIMIAVPYFGYKNHLSTDRWHDGLIRLRLGGYVLSI